LSKHSLSGNFKQLIEKAKAGEIDVIYIGLPLKAEDRIAHLIEELSDSTASVYFVPDFFVFDLLRSNIHHINGIPIVSVFESPFYGVDGALKRVFDILLGLFILTIIAIPMLVIAICVKITSPGSVLFKQRRYGLKGEEIVVWKFRSMSVCEDGNNVQQAKKNDPRVTKLGAFLRRTSLDELPQFINVLQGHMSIVGPRPHAVAHNELYRKKIKGYMLRHKVKPGITGLAQISGYRGETDTLEKMEGRIKYDLKYIENWSLWLDIKIVLLTFCKGFISSTAY
jgi:putative colanic acid biosynthesis UDP-glucose lipid carrier transferase